MPRKLGVDQPDYGRMTGRRLLGEGQPLRVCVFVAGRVEPEIVFVLRPIAFVLGRDLTGPDVSVGDAGRAVEFERHGAAGGCPGPVRRTHPPRGCVDSGAFGQPTQSRAVAPSRIALQCPALTT